MAATLMDIINGAMDIRTKPNGPEFSPAYLKVFDKFIANTAATNSALTELSNKVSEQLAYNKTADKLGKAGDVQKTIRDMLSAKLTADKIDQERNDRFMKVAEQLVPQVTQEQLDAIDAQKKAYTEHKKNLEYSLSLEKAKAEWQNKLAQDVADKQIAVAKKQLAVASEQIAAEKAQAEFAKNDKYGTITSAIGGLGNSAQDPLSKFLVAGLGRFVKEKKEAPIAKAIDDKYNAELEKVQKNYTNAETTARDNTNAKKSKYAKALADREAAIQEEYAVKSAKYGIKDPGSKARLYEERRAKVAGVASQGANLETTLLANNSGSQKFANGGYTNIGAIPVSRRQSDGSAGLIGTPTAKTTSTPSMTPKPAPGNAKFTKAFTQGTAPVTPKNPARRQPSLLGSKAGFIDLSGITGALKGIVGGFTKFLGPWGLAANALMSVDKLVPVITTGAGALMDLTKMIMPTLVSSLIEGFNLIMGGINGLVEVLDDTILGNKFLKRNKAEISNKESAALAKEQESLNKRIASKKARERGLGAANIDTTTQFGSISVSKQAVPMLTNPIEEITTRTPTANNTSSQLESFVTSMGELPAVLEGMQKSVLDLKLQPSGTTPIMVTPPYLTGWTV